MSIVGIRELGRRASALVKQVEDGGSVVLVTRHGRAVAAVVPIDRDLLEDFVLANAPEFVGARREAEEDWRAGRTRALADVVREIEERQSRPIKEAVSQPRRSHGG